MSDGGSESGPHAPVRVHLDGEPFAGAARRIAAELADETVASRLADGDPSAPTGPPGADPSVWGPSAVGRLGWLGLPRGSRALVGQIEALRSSFTAAGAHRVLLVAGPAVAAGARALAEPSGARLTVLDGPDPVQVADALAGELARTVLVVSSKSGGTVETDSQRRIFAQVFAAEGIDPASRMVVVTDPGSPLAELAEQEAAGGGEATHVGSPTGSEVAISPAPDEGTR